MAAVRNVRRRLGAGCVALLLVAAASACSDDDDDDDAGATTTADTEVEATTEPTDEATDPTTAASDAAAPTTEEVAGIAGPTIGDDGRLVPGDCPEGEANADPDLGVTDTAVNVAWVSVDFSALASIGFAPSGMDLGAAMTPLIDELNAAGGICGRTVDYTPIQFDVLANEGGNACIQVTEDRRNAIVLGQGGFVEALCVAEAGTVTLSQQDMSEGDVELAGGSEQLIFVIPPSNEQAYETSTELFLPLLEGQTVGVWYGSISQAQGDAVEANVFPILDEAGIDYIAYRTDFQGPNDPEGQAILSVAATDFVSNEVDVVLNFTQNTNHTGIQGEMAAQGHIPVWLSANIGANSANELFAEAFGVTEIADGERISTYTLPPSEVADEPWAISCNEDLRAVGVETFEPGTFEFAALSNTCAQFDLLVAVLTAVGPEITQERIIEELEALPPFPMQNGLGPKQWGPGLRFATHEMTELVYDGATNTYAVGDDTIEIG
jgi:hypothetical protein